MKDSPAKALPFLAIFVLCIYTFRQTDISFTSTLSPAFSRQLQESAPSDEASIETMCQGFTANQAFSDTQVNIAEKITKNLEKIRGGNPMVNIIDSQGLTSSSSNPATTPAKTSDAGEDKKAAAIDYGTTIIPIMGFMLAFFFLTFFCYVSFFCTCLSSGEKFCCCCKMGDLSKGKACYSVLSILLVAVVVGISFAGLYISDHFQEDTNSAICTMSSFLEDIEHGSLADNWIGLYPASSKLDSIKSNVDDLMGQENKLNEINSTFASNYKNISKALVTSNNKFKDRKLTKAKSSTSEPKYTPYFIQTYGPPTKESSTTGAIEYEIASIYSQVQSGLPPLLEGMSQFKNSGLDLVSMINTAKNFSDHAATAVQNVVDTGDKYAAQIEKSTITAESGLRSTFMVLCAIPAFGIVWCILTSLLKIRVFFILSCGWWLLITASLIGWVLSLFLIPTNITLMESCGVLNKALVEPEFFNKMVKFFVKDSQNVETLLHTCFHGDGDILVAMGLTFSSYEFTPLCEKAEEASNTLKSKIQSSTGSQVIPSVFSKLDEFKTGKAHDSQETLADLQTLNQNSDSTSTCEPIQDIWVLNSKSCTDDSGTKFLSTHDAGFNVGKKTCIGFDQWMTGTLKDIEGRYQALKEQNKCQTDDDDQKSITAKALVKSFIKNRNELSALVEEMESDFTNIEATFEAYIGGIDEFSNVATEMSSGLRLIDSDLFSKSNGLMNNMKCSIIPKDLKAFHDSLCVGFIPTLFQLSVVMMLFSFLSSFAACSLFCLARRYINTESNDDKLGHSRRDEPTDKGIQMAFMVYNSTTDE